MHHRKEVVAYVHYVRTKRGVLSSQVIKDRAKRRDGVLANTVGSGIVTEEVPVIDRVCLRAQGALRDDISQYRIVESFCLVPLVPVLVPKNTVMEG